MDKIAPYAPHASLDRAMSWILPAIVALTPLVIIYALIRPNVGQTFFFQMAVLAAMATLGIGWMLGWKPLPRGLTAPVVLFALNGVALLGSLSVSQSPVFSLKQALLPISGFLFFCLIVVNTRRRQLLERVRLMLIVVGSMLALYGILQHFGLEFLHYSEQIAKNRVIATLGHPNYLASVLGPVAFLILSYTMGRGGVGRKVLGFLLIFMTLFCIMLARTRGVWLGIVLSTVVVVFVGTIYSLRHKVGLRWMQGLALGGTLMLIGLSLSVIFLLPALHANIDIKERLQADTEIKSRIYYWHAAIDLGMEKKIFGQGYAMFDPLFWDYTLKQQKSEMGPFYYDMLPSISGRNPGHVHNEYLEVLAEQGFTGLLALIALLVFFGWFGYHAIMVQRDPDQALPSVAVFGSFICILVDALFGFPWRLPVSLMVLMVVLAWLYDMIYPQSPGLAVAENAPAATDPVSVGPVA